MVKPTKARVIAAEKSSRPFGWALTIGGLLWEGLSRLGEHIVLSWVAERIQGQAFMVSAISWSVDHPILFFLELALIYVAYVFLRTIFGKEDETGGNGDVMTTYGPQSPINQAGRDIIFYAQNGARGDLAPDIAMEILSGRFQKSTVSGLGRDDGEGPVYKATHRISLAVRFVNKSQRQATIESYHLDIHMPDRIIRARRDGSQAEMGTSRPIEIPGVKELEPNLLLTDGVGATRIMRFYMNVQEPKEDNFEDFSRFVLTAIDSFKSEYVAIRQASNWPDARLGTWPHA
jgi:hypothetical protein